MDDPVGYLYRTSMNLFRSRARRAALALRKTVFPVFRTDEFSEAEDRTAVLRALAELTPRRVLLSS